jgi:magnesium transporter
MGDVTLQESPMHDVLLNLLRGREIDDAKALLDKADPEEIARLVSGLPSSERQLALQLLEHETAVAVFEQLGPEAAPPPPAEQPPPTDPGTIHVLLAERQFGMLRGMLVGTNPVDVAHLIELLRSDEAVVVFRLLPKSLAVDVFEHMEGERRQGLLLSFTDERARELVGGMSPDDRTRLLDEVPAGVAHRLIQLLSPGERRATLALLGYPESSAGRLMTPDFVDLRATMTAAQALERLRRLAVDKETIYYAYVTDASRKLVGAVSLKDLVLTEPEVHIHDIMEANPKAVTTHTDQEEVARVISDYDLLAVPVVDGEDRLVGIVTHDDVLDIIEAEATEDIYRYGAVPVAERSYFRTNLFSRARRRGVWLLALLVVNTVTGAVIAGQEELLARVAILAAFIPLLIGTGGNIGAQSSTVVVRGLATGEAASRRIALTIGGEAGVGILLGAGLGVMAFGWAFLLGGGELRVAVIVSTTLVGIAAMATVVGGGLPFLFRALRVDPAIASAPLITTVMDIFGVLAYFLIASALLNA